jgi:hypothetical protein
MIETGDIVGNEINGMTRALVIENGNLPIVSKLLGINLEERIIGMTLEKHNRIIKEKDAALSGMKAENEMLSQEIANAKKTIERGEALRTEYQKDIADLKAQRDSWKALYEKANNPGKYKVEEP